MGKKLLRDLGVNFHVRFLRVADEYEFFRPFCVLARGWDCDKISIQVIFDFVPLYASEPNPNQKK